MNLATTLDANWNVRVGKRIQVRRTDGSNLTHQAVCTESNRRGLALCVNAAFAVGEVVELLMGRSDGGSPRKERARVLYRKIDMYGLDWLNDPAASERLAAARQLLADLKTAYGSLPSRQRDAIRSALRERAAEAA
jgi:hypothetical protein